MADFTLLVALLEEKKLSVLRRIKSLEQENDNHYDLICSNNENIEELKTTLAELEACLLKISEIK